MSRLIGICAVWSKRICFSLAHLNNQQRILTSLMLALLTSSRAIRTYAVRDLSLAAEPPWKLASSK